MSLQPQTRVRALLSSNGTAIKDFGHGTYIGDLVPDVEPFRSMRLPNPCIRLDNGRHVWGFQCWWGPAQAVDNHVKGAQSAGVELVNINETFTEYVEPLNPPEA